MNENEQSTGNSRIGLGILTHRERERLPVIPYGKLKVEAGKSLEPGIILRAPE